MWPNRTAIEMLLDQVPAFVLDLMQIILATVGALLVGRFQLGERYDAYIMCTLLMLALTLLLMHILVNGHNIYKTLFK